MFAAHSISVMPIYDDDVHIGQSFTQILLKDHSLIILQSLFLGYLIWCVCFCCLYTNFNISCTVVCSLICFTCYKSCQHKFYICWHIVSVIQWGVNCIQLRGLSLSNGRKSICRILNMSCRLVRRGDMFGFIQSC